MITHLGASRRQMEHIWAPPEADESTSGRWPRVDEDTSYDEELPRLSPRSQLKERMGAAIHIGRRKIRPPKGSPCKISCTTLTYIHKLPLETDF